jgi:hypothetical protein
MLPVSTATLRQLGEEPFGSQLYRARKSSGVELRDAAELVSRYMFTSHTTLHRLEKLPHVPEDRHRRALAYLVLLVYGFDPRQFGLSADDLPKDLNAEALVELGGPLRSRCSWPQAFDLAVSA